MVWRDLVCLLRFLTVKAAWKCVVVSSAFEGKRSVARHRLVYGALGDAMQDFVHAFSPKTLTPAEFEAKGGTVAHSTPGCMGGGKHG